MKRAVIACAAVLAVAGCENESHNGDMPAARSWSAPSPVASQAGAASGNPHAGMGGNPHAGMGGNPHAGMAMGGDPHAGMAMGGDPHAGMAMGGDPHAGMGGNPHAGMATGGDPRMANMKPPDPDRSIDPDRFLRGVIDATADAKKAIEPGAIIFLVVRPIDPVTEEVIGAPLAVERLDVKSLPVEFELTEAQAMVAGTVLEGDVIIDARVDGDGDALSKEPGDVVGSVRAEVPARKLRLELDTVLQ